MPRRADDEMANDRLLRHGFVWLVAVFSSTGGLQSGYGIGLATGLATSSTFQDAFPDLNPNYYGFFVDPFEPHRVWFTSRWEPRGGRRRS